MPAKITQEIKDRWIADLRSGKYEQAEGKLKIDDSYCCLGVLSHITAPEEFKNANDNNYWIFDTAFAETFVDAYNILYFWAGSDFRVKLANMNDTGSTFNQIADYIQENLNVR